MSFDVGCGNDGPTVGGNTAFVPGPFSSAAEKMPDGGDRGVISSGIHDQWSSSYERILSTRNLCYELIRFSQNRIPAESSPDNARRTIANRSEWLEVE